MIIDDFLKFFEVLHLRDGNTNIKALNFLLKYKDIDFIGKFINKFYEILSKNNEEIKIKTILTSLKFKTWDQIKECQIIESTYYFFLRIKIFLLTVEYDSDIEEDNEWLEFFEEKFIRNLH